MGILAQHIIEALFVCGQCGKPIERLDHGLMLDWNSQPRLAKFDGCAVILHGPEGGTCYQAWIAGHRGNWAIYSLTDMLVRLGVHYGLEWQHYAKLAAERAHLDRE